MTVTKYNYRDVSAVIDFCEKLGVNWFMHYNFIPTGRGRDMIHADITPEEREELLRMIYMRDKSSNISLLSTAPQFARIALQHDGSTYPNSLL